MVNLAKDYITHDIIALKLVKEFEPQIKVAFGKKWERLRNVMVKEAKTVRLSPERQSGKRKKKKTLNHGKLAGPLPKEDKEGHSWRKGEWKMPKREIEFIDVDTHYEWKPVEGDTLGIKEKILSRDPETKSYTRLLKFPPGIKTAETLVHDFWEEVLIVEGELIDLAKNQTFGAGFYACRPPGMKHGPYHIPRGCTTFEIRYYLEKTR